MKGVSDITVFDLETTGLDSRVHEIIEIGAIRVSADLSRTVGEFNVKVLPVNIQNAMSEALAINGYSPESWRDAEQLHSALSRFSVFISGSVLAAYNNVFDMSFLLAALRNESMPVTADYHYFDIFSVAFEESLQKDESHGLTLSDMCSAYGIKEPPVPHVAIEDARAALNVLRAIRSARKG